MAKSIVLMLGQPLLIQLCISLGYFNFLFLYLCDYTCLYKFVFELQCMEFGRLLNVLPQRQWSTHTLVSIRKWPITCPQHFIICIFGNLFRFILHRSMQMDFHGDGEMQACTTLGKCTYYLQIAIWKNAYFFWQRFP